MKEYVTALIFVSCAEEISTADVSSFFYEQEHGRRWSGWRMETKKIFWPAS
jgi:hypothetical protein